MSGVIIEPFTSIEAAERNFARLNEAIVAMQGGSIAIENIEGYENLVTKVDLADAVKLLQYKVGDIHISESDQDPAEKFGYGKWEIIARGRTLTGVDVPPEGEVGYTPDQDFQQPAQEGGEKTHTLTVDEMPSHDHTQTQSAPDWDRGDGSKYNRKYSVGSDVQFDVKDGDLTRKCGGDQPHSIMQPYYCVYIWKRVE